MNVYIYTHTYTHTHTHTFIHMYTGSADRLAGVARLLPLRQRARGSTGCECEGGSGCWRRNKTTTGKFESPIEGLASVGLRRLSMRGA